MLYIKIEKIYARISTCRSIEIFRILNLKNSNIPNFVTQILAILIEI